MAKLPIAGGHPGGGKRRGRRRHRWGESFHRGSACDIWSCARCHAFKLTIRKHHRTTYCNRVGEWTTTAPECVPREGK